MEEIDEAAGREGFFATATKVAKSGFAMLGASDLERRLAACRACVLVVSKQGLLTCSACGCDMKIKARFAATTCPIDPHW